ncbi:MAG: SMP-30/gluconolactonase/LRE family protein [Puia sp.]
MDEGLKFANGLTLTPDQTQLYVTESASHWVWVYQILPMGNWHSNNTMAGCIHVTRMKMPGATGCDATQQEEYMSQQKWVFRFSIRQGV